MRQKYDEQISFNTDEVLFVKIDSKYLPMLSEYSSSLVGSLDNKAIVLCYEMKNGDYKFSVRINSAIEDDLEINELKESISNKFNFNHKILF